jgi:hypothetical protein
VPRSCCCFNTLLSKVVGALLSESGDNIMASPDVGSDDVRQYDL